MSTTFLIVSYLAAINAWRAPSVMAGATSRSQRLIGVALAWLVAWGLALSAEPLLSALDITPATYRLAGGLVVVLGGAWVGFGPDPMAEPVPAGPGRWLWPVVYPALLRPEVVALILTTATIEGVRSTTLAAAVALLVVAASVSIDLSAVGERVRSVAARLLGLLLVMAGVWLIIDGIRLV